MALEYMLALSVPVGLISFVDTFFHLLATTFMAVCVLQTVQTTPGDVRRSLAAMVRSSPALLLFDLLVHTPALLDSVIGDGTSTNGPHKALSGLILLAGMFIPPLLVVRPSSLAAALRDSPAVLRATFLVALVGMVLTSGLALIAQNAAQLMLNVLMLRLRAKAGFTYLMIMKTTGALSQVIAAPLLAYGGVLRTLLVLQAQTQRIVRQ